VWQQLRDQQARGVAIVLISTDLDEVMALADRCHVMYRGRLVGDWDRATLDRDEVGLAMGGGAKGLATGDETDEGPDATGMRRDASAVAGREEA
jgi:ABC-type sugar transport system ATPase subunit